MIMSVRKHVWLMVFPLAVCVALAVWFYDASFIQTDYARLPTVSCIDPTKPITEEFHVSLTITLNGLSYPLEPTIGHDYGNCLRVIHTNDASGTVYIQSNNAHKVYTLGNFFETWHKIFDKNQVVGKFTDKMHTISVFINNVPSGGYDLIKLEPNQQIHIIYE